MDTKNTETISLTKKQKLDLELIYIPFIKTNLPFVYHTDNPFFALFIINEYGRKCMDETLFDRFTTDYSNIISILSSKQIKGIIKNVLNSTYGRCVKCEVKVNNVHSKL